MIKKIAILSISIMVMSGLALNGVISGIRDSLGLTQAQSEYLVTMQSISVLIFILLSNIVVGKIGVKKTVTLGLVIASAAGMAPIFLSQYEHILLSRIIFGAGIGLFNTLAVSYINILYTGHERATMLGYRSAIEALGQSVLTIVAGLLFSFGWNFTFWVYSVGFVLALFFYLKVPELQISNNQKDENPRKEKMNPFVYVLALFSVMIVISGAAIGIRFAAMATQIMGTGYDASPILATKPLIVIVAGFFFGMLNKWLGKKVFYIGLLCFIVSLFLIGASDGNFTILVIGFLLSALPPAWVFPFIMNKVSQITSGKNQTLAMSIILAGANIGAFVMPFVVQLIERMTGSDALETPYPFMGALLSLIFIGIVFVDFRCYFRKIP